MYTIIWKAILLYIIYKDCCLKSNKFLLTNVKIAFGLVFFVCTLYFTYDTVLKHLFILDEAIVYVCVCHM